MFWRRKKEDRASKSTSLNLKDPALAELLGGKPVSSGVTVTPSTALQAGAVFACVRILAEGVASLPLIFYRRLARGKDRAIEHPLYSLLHDLPNPEITSLELRETLQAHLALWGNAFAEIAFGPQGEIEALWPLRPDKVRVFRGQKDKKLWYEIALPDGHQTILPFGQVLHIRGLGSDGIIGYSPIRMAREAIGLTIAAEEFGARFFANNARPAGVLEHPGNLSDEAAKRLRESWEERHKGLEQAHRVAVLEEGMKWEAIGIPNDDAQFIQTRKFQLQEIARIFKVPPHMLADLERATFSNVEQQSLDFVVHTLGPWLVRWEMAIKRDLLLPQERKTYFAEFLVNGLLRGDIKSRHEAYAIGRQWGWLSADDIREMENMNPLPDGQGEQYLIPLNMAPASGNNGQGQRTLENRSVTGRRRLRTAYRNLFEETASRIIRREKADVMQAAGRLLSRRDIPEFNDWLIKFYDEHRGYVEKQMIPILHSYAKVVHGEATDEVGIQENFSPELEDYVLAYGQTYSIRHTASSLGQIRDVLTKAEAEKKDLVKALEERFAEWEEKRPAKIAGRETVQAGEAVTRATYLAAGIPRLTWVKFDNCPYCQALDGKTISINGLFLKEGENFQPEGATESLRVRTNKSHPPIHDECLPGNTHISSCNRITASSKRWYDGNLVIIHTAAGNELSCTPNHPILTPHGWIAANSLDIGGYVFSCLDSNGGTPISADDQNMPILIEDVAETFVEQSQMVAIPVPTSAEDFHGDGIYSEITIIRTNRLLRDRNYTLFGKHSMKSPLQMRNIKHPVLASLSSETFFGKCFDSASRDDISSPSLSFPFLRSHLTRSNQTSFASPTMFNTFFQKPPFDDSTVNAQLDRQGIFGLAGKIFSDQIINIEYKTFHGYVYNLQTEQGFYLAESIITHNCDCMIAPGT